MAKFAYGILHFNINPKNFIDKYNINNIICVYCQFQWNDYNTCFIRLYMLYRYVFVFISLTELYLKLATSILYSVVQPLGRAAPRDDAVPINEHMIIHT